MDVGLWADIAGQAGAVPPSAGRCLDPPCCRTQLGCQYLFMSSTTASRATSLSPARRVSVGDHQARVRPHARELLRPLHSRSSTCSASPTRSHSSKRERFSWSVLSELVEETADQTGAATRDTKSMSASSHTAGDCRKETSVGGRLHQRYDSTGLKCVSTGRRDSHLRCRRTKAEAVSSRASLTERKRILYRV